MSFGDQESKFRGLEHTRSRALESHTSYPCLDFLTYIMGITCISHSVPWDGMCNRAYKGHRKRKEISLYTISNVCMEKNRALDDAMGQDVPETMNKMSQPEI